VGSLTTVDFFEKIGTITHVDAYAGYVCTRYLVLFDEASWNVNKGWSRYISESELEALILGDVIPDPTLQKPIELLMLAARKLSGMK
jgi:hypothetical protein